MLLRPLLPKSLSKHVFLLAFEVWSVRFRNMAFKKKLYQLNPNETKAVVIHQTKREKRKASVTMHSNERYVREILSNKLSGTHMGLWLLVPEYLRLGAWDLL